MPEKRAGSALLAARRFDLKSAPPFSGDLYLPHVPAPPGRVYMDRSPQKTGQAGCAIGPSCWRISTLFALLSVGIAGFKRRALAEQVGFLGARAVAQPHSAWRSYQLPPQSAPAAVPTIVGGEEGACCS